jgi:hypothetical protein
VLDAALLSSTLSDKMLSKIAILLFMLVAGVLTVFGQRRSMNCHRVAKIGQLRRE